MMSDFRGGWGSKIFKNRRRSLMDDPFYIIVSQTQRFTLLYYFKMSHFLLDLKVHHMFSRKMRTTNSKSSQTYYYQIKLFFNSKKMYYKYILILCNRRSRLKFDLSTLSTSTTTQVKTSKYQSSYASINLQTFLVCY